MTKIGNSIVAFFNGLPIAISPMNTRRQLLKAASASTAVGLSSPLTHLFSAASPQVIHIDSQRELFVDNLLIETMSGVEQRLHSPIKTPRAKSPLPVHHMKTIIKDGDIFHAWYRGSDPDYAGERHTGHAGETLHYARSRDGHEWQFPDMGINDIDCGQGKNCILANLPPYLTNFMPFLDTRPGVDSRERFKTLAGYPGKVAPKPGLFGFVSPDGISWTKRTKEAIAFNPEWRHAFDSPNITFWSSAEEKYVCYFRTWTPGENLRSISRSTSEDFETWTEPVAMNPNLPGEHLYTNHTQPYARAPHIYLAFPTRFVPDRGDAPGSDLKDVNATDILFMTTRAGAKKYHRTFTKSFIRPGMDPDAWRNRSNYVAQNLIQTGPEELSLWHRSGDRYVLRPDGFISINAESKPGELITRTLVFTGKTLSLNLSTSAIGGIQVELQQPDGTPISGFAIDDCPVVYGDTLDQEVTWTGGRHLATVADHPVRLRFVMKECDLYSFQFS